MATVLVVDRERNIRQGLKDGLKKSGYDVIDAANGQDGLEAAGQDRIDLILLDVNLPKLDGWEVLTQLKRDQYTRTIPVIMLARFPSNETEATGYRLGAAHVLAKPWHPDSLMLTIRVVLRDAQRSATEEPRAPRDPQDQPPSRSATEEEPRAREVSKDSPPKRQRPSKPPEVFGTGGRFTALERALGTGIRQRSITLLEGTTGSGKSVICYYLVHGSLVDGRSVAYFTSQHTADGLAEQMDSLNMGVRDDLREEYLKIHTISKPGSMMTPRRSCPRWSPTSNASPPTAASLSWTTSPARR